MESCYASLGEPVVANLYCYLASKWFPKITFRLKTLKDLWSYSVDVFVSTIIGAIYGQADALLIGKICEPAGLGFYYRAKSLESMLYNYTSQSLLSVFFPAMSAVKDEPERFNAIVLKTHQIICVISFTLLGLLFLISEDIMVILFSSKWLPAVPLFRILLISSFVYPMTALFNSVLLSTGNSKGLLQITLIRYLVLTPTFIVLVFFGIKPFLLSFVAATITSLLFSTRFAAKQMRISPIWFWKKTIPFISADILIAGSLELLSHKIKLNHYFHLVSFSIVFLACFFSTLKICKIEGLSLFLLELRGLICKIKDFTTSNPSLLHNKQLPSSADNQHD